MNCEEFSNLLDAYTDGTLSEKDASRMEEHAKTCATCTARITLQRDLQHLDEDAEVPGSFSSSWRQAISEEKQMDKTNHRHIWKGLAAAAAALVFLVGGTALTRSLFSNGQTNQNASYSTEPYAYSGKIAQGSGIATNFSYDNGSAEYGVESAPYDSAVLSRSAGNDSYADDSVQQEAKIIRNASFTLKTRQFDTDLAAIKQSTADMGGRVEYLSSSGDSQICVLRTATLTLRIPENNLDAFIQSAKGIGNVTDMTESQTDVSDSYYDVQTRLDTQKAKMERLQSMISTAENTSDLIDIENAIADTQYLIDSYTSSLNRYDSRISYSEVNVTLQEVVVQEDVSVSFGTRLWASIVSSLEEGWAFLQDMCIFLLCALPWLIAIGLIVFIAVRIHRKRKNNRQTKTSNKE